MKKLTLAFALISMAAMVSLAAADTKDSSKQPPKMPEQITLTGTVQKGSGDTIATLKASDGKIYKLETAKVPNNVGKASADGNPPPAPPANEKNSAKSTGKQPEPPKPATEADIKAFIGKKATVKGFIPGSKAPDDTKKDLSKVPAKEDSFIVMSISDK